MEGLPKLPGLDFDNRVKLKHHLPHSLEYVNGYRIPKKPPSGIGGDPLTEDSIAYSSSMNDPTLYDPVLTYGRVKHPAVAPFKPHYVLYDKMVLTFFAFFKQSIPESPIEHYRIRHVKIIYFLEDDSMTVIEPSIANAGFDQGRLVRRCKIHKNTKGDPYTWKDLNIGVDVELNGIVFHITDCDPYTKEYMLSQGIELKEAECSPNDPVLTERMINSNIQRTRKTPALDDKLRRYLEFQGKVLSFDCVLDETEIPFGECMSFKLFYYLEDDTVAIKELKENREGRDRFPMLLRKTKLPKNWKRLPITFPSICLEVSDNEVNEFYQPKDFRVGGTIFVFGRRFLLLDCDNFTKKYYESVLKEPQPDKMSIKFPHKNKPKRALPDYIGLGTPEDSLTSCFGLTPKAPKKDVITYLLNANKNLRYGCILDNAHPEDKIRKFILSFSLADGTIKISEPPIRNSGIIGGKFLGSQKVWRPDCNPNKPDYYTPKDLYIGATLIINCHRFIIESADLYVYRYMREHPEFFTPEAIGSVRNYHLLLGNLKDDIKDALIADCEEYKLEQCQKKDEKNEQTYEESLRRINVVKGESDVVTSLNELDHLDNPNYIPGDAKSCPFLIKGPKIEQETLVAEDQCKELPSNPHKIVRFKDA